MQSTNLKDAIKLVNDGTLVSGDVGGYNKEDIELNRKVMYHKGVCDLAKMVKEKIEDYSRVYSYIEEKDVDKMVKELIGEEKEVSLETKEDVNIRDEKEV